MFIRGGGIGRGEVIAGARSVCGAWVGACGWCAAVVEDAGVSHSNFPPRPPPHTHTHTHTHNARPHPHTTHQSATADWTPNAPAKFLPALAQSRGSEHGPTAAVVRTLCRERGEGAVKMVEK